MIMLSVCKARFFFNLIFLYSRFLLVIYFIHISIYMSIPISQFIPPPPTPLPLSSHGVHTFVLYICVSISALQTGSPVSFFQFYFFLSNLYAFYFFLVLLHLLGPLVKFWIQMMRVIILIFFSILFRHSH